MKLSNSNGKGALCCSVSVSQTMTLRARVPCDLGEDAVGYAVCRFLTRAQRFATPYVKESHDLRFAKGKGGRSRRHTFIAPAAVMELPGAWAFVKVTVTAQGVTVDYVGLYNSFSEAQEDNAYRTRSAAQNTTVPGY